ncbi:MAG: hypothetical protein U0736_11660 [Gemmataceae bacterium]
MTPRERPPGHPSNIANPTGSASSSGATFVTGIQPFPSSTACGKSHSASPTTAFG